MLVDLQMEGQPWEGQSLRGWQGPRRQKHTVLAEKQHSTRQTAITNLPWWLIMVLWGLLYVLEPESGTL